MHFGVVHYECFIIHALVVFVGVVRKFLFPISRQDKEPLLLVICVGIDRWLMDSPHKGPEMRNIGVLFYVSPRKLLNKDSCRWFETSWGSYNATFMKCFIIDAITHGFKQEW